MFAEDSNDVLSVYFLDVGQGDAIFIETPSKERVLIDGGPNRKVLSELGDILPFGDKRIDVVLATHPDADHITGLVEVVKRFDVGIFLDSGALSSNEIDDFLFKALEDDGVEKVSVQRGVVLSLGKTVSLQVIFPEEDVSNLETNAASLVVRLEYKDTSFIFTGDAPKRTEYLLLQSNENLLDADVLQVGHHGSDTSTSEIFLEAVTPKYAVISSGKNNRYGHPHQNVLDTLDNLGIETLNTAKQGRIIFETDGEGLWIK